MPGHRITSLLLVCTLGLSLPVRAQIAPGVSLACMAPAIAAAPAPSGVALARIAGDGRKLLALRGYLRARGLAERWSWSDAQIAAYAGSPEQSHAQAAVARVQAVFPDANPGFALHVNLQVRSLDEQLRKWNENASVAAAAEAIATDAESACRRDPNGFVGWLRGWTPPTPVNLAVPGLSPHGQARAFDFQVMKDGLLVAGTDSRRIDADWIEAGWADRLARAVQASGEAFSGPLQSPREPWHYAFRPSP